MCPRVNGIFFFEEKIPLKTKFKELMFSKRIEAFPRLKTRSVPKVTLLERKERCITIEDLRARATKNSL